MVVINTIYFSAIDTSKSTLRKWLLVIVFYKTKSRHKISPVTTFCDFI